MTSNIGGDFLGEYGFEVQEIDLNKSGLYYLKLAVEQPHLQGEDSGGIHVRASGGDKYEPKRHVRSETIDFQTPCKMLQVTNISYVFTLPKGFFTGARNGSSYLLVQVYSVRDWEDDGRLVAVGRAEITPPNTIEQVHMSAAPADHISTVAEVVTLYKPHGNPMARMHCGRLHVLIKMRHNPDKEPEAPTTVSESTQDAKPAVEDELLVEPEPSTQQSAPSRQEARGAPQPPVSGRSVWDNGSQTVEPESQHPQHTRLSPMTERLESPVSQPASRQPRLPDKSPTPTEDQVRLKRDALLIPPALPAIQKPTTIKKSPTHDKMIPIQTVPIVQPRRPARLARSPESLKSDMSWFSAGLADNLTPRTTAVHDFTGTTGRQAWPSTCPDEGVFAIIHAAAGLPLTSQEALPRPYCIMKISGAVAEGSLENSSSTAAKASMATQPSLHRTQCPVWEEPLYLSPQVRDVADLVLTLEVADKGTGELLLRYRFPLTYLQPYSQYHLEMRQCLSSNVSGASLFVSLLLKDAPSMDVPSGEFKGIQVTMPSVNIRQPEWNHAFLFTQAEQQTPLFTPGTALIIELYQAAAAVQGGVWRLQEMIGMACLLLDRPVFIQLSSQTGRAGMRLDSLPLQKTCLVTADGRSAPSLDLVLCLVQSQQYGSLPSVSSLDLLPHLDMTFPVDEPALFRLKSDTLTGLGGTEIESNQQSTRFRQKPLKDGEMPPHDALESLLPEYKYIFVDPKGPQPTDRSLAQSQPKWDKLDVRGEDLERTTMGLLDYQMAELERYRSAVKTMGQDIVGLRQEIQERESEASRLRLELQQYNDATQLLLDSQEMDGITKPELASKYVAIKQKLNRQTVDLREYKDRVTELQNDLIKRNDEAKQYQELSEAHKSQQQLVQRLQVKMDKVRRLEDTCRNQEKVIEKMESMLSRHGKTDRAPKPSEANDALRQENMRLRNELQDVKEGQRVQSSMTDSQHQERLQLLEKLERQNSRVRSLESQIADNARHWARERSDLQMRLREAEYGLSQAQVERYRTYPKIQSHTSTKPREPPRKYSKAPAGVPTKFRGHNHPSLRDSLF